MNQKKMNQQTKVAANQPSARVIVFTHVKEAGKMEGKRNVRVRVDTRRYELSHWHKPRGRGYWGFSVDNGQTFREVWVSGLYTEAKQEAVKQAHKWGFDRVEVLP